METHAVAPTEARPQPTERYQELSDRLADLGEDLRSIGKGLRKRPYALDPAALRMKAAQLAEAAGLVDELRDLQHAYWQREEAALAARRPRS